MSPYAGQRVALGPRTGATIDITSTGSATVHFDSGGVEDVDPNTRHMPGMITKNWVMPSSTTPRRKRLWRGTLPTLALQVPPPKTPPRAGYCSLHRSPGTRRAAPSEAAHPSSRAGDGSRRRTAMSARGCNRGSHPGRDTGKGSGGEAGCLAAPIVLRSARFSVLHGPSGTT